MLVRKPDTKIKIYMFKVLIQHGLQLNQLLLCLLWAGTNLHRLHRLFPLRPAAAKTIHCSQGDTAERTVVNFNTKKVIPHIHYVGLSKVTKIEGLCITDLCEEKIVVNPHVAAEMEFLRKERALKLSVIPIYEADQVLFKLC